MAITIVAPGGATTPDQGITNARLGVDSIIFRSKRWKGYPHASDGTVPASGCLLSVVAAAPLAGVEVTILREGINCSFRVSAADARVIAAELVAAWMC